ncbi:MAG: hypothetical protein HQ567_27910 [Candidatus Nealsonbacteria bacterium]|nr:hypothetical protein [Candidatus Nealsonbacteria bacterium]
MSGRPGVYSGFDVYGRASERVAGDRPVEGKEAAAHGSRIDQADTVEISREAESQLIGQLTEEQERQVQQLKVRDREVRAHEQAHLAAAGPYSRGGASFDYQSGPDGQRYAVGGEVSIDSSPVPDDPEATIRKAQVIRAAAMAPASPSAQDRQVAATAAKMEVRAQKELRRKQVEEQEEAGETAGANDPETFSVTDADDRDEAEQLVGTLFDALA